MFSSQLMNLSYMCCVSYRCAHFSFHTIRIIAENSHTPGVYTFFNTPTAEALVCLPFPLALLAFLGACDTRSVLPTKRVLRTDVLLGGGCWWGWSLEVQPYPRLAGPPPLTPVSLSLF